MYVIIAASALLAPLRRAALTRFACINGENGVA
jgi:hypothetical protein